MAQTIGKLGELLEAHFGMQTTYRLSPPAFQIGVAVTQLVGYDPNRLGIVIVNTGATTAYLSPENTIAAGAGIVLAPNGGSVSLNWDKDFDLVAQQWFAIAGVATNCMVLEVIGI